MLTPFTTDCPANAPARNCEKKSSRARIVLAEKGPSNTSRDPDRPHPIVPRGAREELDSFACHGGRRRTAGSSRSPRSIMEFLDERYPPSPAFLPPTRRPRRSARLWIFRHDDFYESRKLRAAPRGEDGSVPGAPRCGARQASTRATLRPWLTAGIGVRPRRHRVYVPWVAAAPT